MRKMITLWLLLISSFSIAQPWEGGLSNTLQRRPSSKGYDYQIIIGKKPGTIGLTETKRLDSLLALRPPLPVGQKGQVFKVSTDNTNIYAPAEPLVYGQFIYSDAQKARAFTNGQSTQLQIFNAFKRFSHGTTPVNPEALVPSNNIPGNPQHTNSWSYDTVSHRFKSTFNTGDIIGTFSNDKFKNYVHTLTIGSTDIFDNDNVGVVIAFVEDNNDMVKNYAYGLNPADFNWAINTVDSLIPNQHTLSVYRSRNGASRSYYVMYDNGKLTSQLIADGTNQSGLYNTTAFWSGNTCDMSITKSGAAGDSILINTSQYSDAPGGKGALAFPIFINLNSLPILAKFKGAQAYGYVCQSQANAFFTNINFSGSNNVVYDLRNGSVYPFTGTGYVLDPNRSIYSEPGLGHRFYWRNKTEHTFGYVLPDNTYDVIVGETP